MSKTWKKVSMALAALMVAAMMAGCTTPAPADASTAPNADVSTEATATPEVTAEPTDEPTVEPSAEPTVDPAASPDASADPNAAAAPIALNDKISVILPGTVTEIPATEGEGTTIAGAQTQTADGATINIMATTYADAPAEDAIKNATDKVAEVEGVTTADITITGKDGTAYTGKEYTMTAEGTTTVTRVAVIGNSIVTITAIGPEAAITAAKTVMDEAVEVM